MANEIQITVVEEPPQQRPTWKPEPLVPITSHAEYVAMADGLVRTKTFKDMIRAFFAPRKKRLFDAHREMCNDEKASLEAADLDEAKRKTFLVAWDTEQQRIADEARRVEQEAAARAAAEQRRAEEDAALALAAVASTPEEAEAIIEEQITAPVPEPVYIPPMQKATPKVGGISMSERACFEVVDVAKLPKEYIKADDVKIGAVVRSQKMATRIPGVRVWMEKGVSARGR